MPAHKRKRPLLNAGPPSDLSNVFNEERNDARNDNDVVDDYVANRHRALEEKAEAEASDSDDLGDEPEITERDVMNIDISDSDDDESDDSGDSDVAGFEDDDRKGWGASRKLWYGGDTHEYEIMEDDEREEALKDEEDEAIRMQKKALSSMRPEDYVEEDDGSDSGTEGSDKENGNILSSGSARRSRNIASSVLDATAPEVPALVEEMLKHRKEAVVWKNRVKWCEAARMMYHLHASYVSNVAYYLSLRTDPDSEAVDCRTHPVLVRIVRIRTLLAKAQSLPIKEPKKSSHSHGISTQKGSSKIEENAASPEMDAAPVTQANEGVAPRERKQKRKRKTKSSIDGHDDSVIADEHRVEKLLEIRRGSEADRALETAQDQKMRKLNRLVAKMERERKNSEGKRMASGDLDTMRAEPKPVMPYARNDEQYNGGDYEDDDEVMEKMLTKKAKKEARAAKKSAESQPHVYTFKDSVDPEKKRRASSQIVSNRGLTRYRPRSKKTPRMKNRMAYSKAIVRRKGAVRDYAGKPGSTYSGEASGINMSARKGSKLSGV